jgi:hypothetical protein
MELVDKLMEYLDKGSEVLKLVEVIDSWLREIKTNLNFVAVHEGVSISCGVSLDPEDNECVINIRGKHIVYVKPDFDITVWVDMMRMTEGIPEEVMKILKDEWNGTVIIENLDRLIQRLDEHLKELKALTTTIKVIEK